MPEEHIRLDHRVVGLDEKGGSVVLGFADGTTAVHDAVVAADGVHSLVKGLLFGDEEARFTGRIAYRTTFPASFLGGYEIDGCTKWWGEDRHIVIYYVKPDRSEVYFVTSQPEPRFTVESWSAKGDMRTLRAAFEGFHPQVQHVLAACPDVHKWALVDRDPLRQWHDRTVTLLGDACHPMTPYMAQGAAMALEDAAVLSRLLEEVNNRAWHRRCVPPPGSDPQGPDLQGAADLPDQYLAAWQDRCRLGLQLQPMDRPASGIRTLLHSR